jgi:hypothetical protein
LAMSLGFICAIVPTGCISLVWVVVKWLFLVFGL